MRTVKLWHQCEAGIQTGARSAWDCGSLLPLCPASPAGVGRLAVWLKKQHCIPKAESVGLRRQQGCLRKAAAGLPQPKALLAILRLTPRTALSMLPHPHMHPSTLALIRAAIAEDVGCGDVTSEFFIPAESRSKANLVAREAGVMSGSEVARTVFSEIDAATDVRVLVADGTAFEKGDTLMEISGPTRAVLTAERTALNFLQRLCGVATMTRRYVDAVKPHPVKVLDTRKTTPGWRLLEKAAVKDGGGTNHRIGLYDQVMVKDNHLVAAGGFAALQAAIDRVKAARPGIKVQIEADRLEQVEKFLALRGVEMILLDNMSADTLRAAVELVAGRVFLEASGGMTLSTIGTVAATGVDAISVGALTHSARALDLALDFV